MSDILARVALFPARATGSRLRGIAMSRYQSLLILLLLPIGLIVRATAEESISDAERAQHLKQMRELAGSIRLLADPKNEKSAVKLKEEPVLRYADNTRQAHDSALWIWSGGGRPAAI